MTTANDTSSSVGSGRFIWEDGEWKCIKKDLTPLDLLDLVPALPSSTVLSRARVLYDYESNRDDELTVYYGDEVDILTKERNGWWLARKENPSRSVAAGLYITGLIPSNYVVEVPNLPSRPPPLPPGSSAATSPSDTPSSPSSSQASSPAPMDPTFTVTAGRSFSSKRLEGILSELETWENLQVCFKILFFLSLFSFSFSHSYFSLKGQISRSFRSTFA